MVQPCIWFKEEPSQFSMGQTAQSLTCSIMEKPHTLLESYSRPLEQGTLEEGSHFDVCERERNKGRKGALYLCQLSPSSRCNHGHFGAAATPNFSLPPSYPDAAVCVLGAMVGAHTSHTALDIHMPTAQMWLLDILTIT